MSDCGRDVGQLGGHLLVARIEEMDHPRRLERDLQDRVGRADGQRLSEVAGVSHERDLLVGSGVRAWSFNRRRGKRRPGDRRAAMPRHLNQDNQETVPSMTQVETDQAAREASGAHPYGRYLEEFEVGAVYKHWPAKTVTEADDHLFCLITMNHHPLHINDVYAKQSQQGRNVVVGPLRLLAGAGDERLRRQRQGDRQPGHRGAQATRRRCSTATRCSASPRCSRSRRRSPSPTGARSASTPGCSTRTACWWPSSSDWCSFPARSPGAAAGAETTVE